MLVFAKACKQNAHGLNSLLQQLED